TEELVVGLYEKALPALKRALEKHLADTNLLVDAPSVRLCRFALLELNDMLQFGATTCASLVAAEARQQSAEWLRLLEDCLAAAGGLDGTIIPSDSAKAATRRYSVTPYKYDRVPRRDGRFP